MRAGLRRAVPRLAALAALAAAVAGCAYYNTFYSAKRNFADAEIQMAQQPDPEARAGAAAATMYDKAIEGATKVVIEYPRSKWVDDALLLIGRSMLAKGDYEGARTKFGEIGRNFPKSELIDDAVYWTGVAAERDRLRPQAIAYYDSLLANWPKAEHRDDALLRRAHLYLLAKEPARAEPDLRELSTRSGRMGYDAGLELAEALFANNRFADARVEFARVADRAPTEKLRQDARLRMGDCDEALSDFAAAADTYLRLLRDARTDDGQARARLRYATALGMSGRVDEGLRELANVMADQPRTPWAAEAAFRTGYLLEVIRDDFEGARAAYDKVAEQQPGSPFVAQAQSRSQNLERLASFRAATADTSAGDAAAQAAFQSAELYLFQLGKPEKALEEYARLGRDYPNSPLAPRAAFARGWVKARRLNDPAGAKEEFAALVEKWPDSDVAPAARRLLADPTDSSVVQSALPPTKVQFPLVPGHPMYVPPPPAAAKPAAKGPTAAPGAAAVKAAADSAAARSAAAAVARQDSLRARADSIRRAARRTAESDSTGKLQP